MILRRPSQADKEAILDMMGEFEREKSVHDGGFWNTDNFIYEEWLEENAKIKQACKEYSEFRYNTYFKRWKEYLEQQKINNRKGNKRTYIVKVDYNGYTDIYIKSHGTRTTSFTNYRDYAKLFTMPIDELKELFIHDGDTRSEKYKRMEFIDVTDFIKGKGKYRHAEIPAVEVANHITRVL